MFTIFRNFLIFFSKFSKHFLCDIPTTLLSVLELTTFQKFFFRRQEFKFLGTKKLFLGAVPKYLGTFLSQVN